MIEQKVISMTNNRTPDDLNKKNRLLPISDSLRYLLLTILSGVMGTIEMFLWKVGHTDQYGLYFGLAFIGGTFYCARQYMKCRK